MCGAKQLKIAGDFRLPQNQQMALPSGNSLVKLFVVNYWGLFKFVTFPTVLVQQKSDDLSQASLA